MKFAGFGLMDDPLNKCYLLASDMHLFLWGTVGGVMCFAIGAVLPGLISLTDRQTPANLTRGWAVLGVMAFYGFFGGMAADLSGDLNISYKQAIYFGLAWSVVLPTVGRIFQARPDSSGSQQSSNPIQNLAAS